MPMTYRQRAIGADGNDDIGSGGRSLSLSLSLYIYIYIYSKKYY